MEPHTDSSDWPKDSRKAKIGLTAAKKVVVNLHYPNHRQAIG